MDLKLKNYMEVLVFDTLDEVLKSNQEICSCEKCRLDVAAKALNSLKPKYVVTHHGEIYTRTNVLHQQSKTDVLSVVVEAVEHIKKNPKHTL